MIVGILMAIWVVIYIAFRTPPVQHWITGLISKQLSKKLNTKVSLDGLDIDLFDEVELDGVYVEDQQQDTLLYVKKFRVNIEPSALFNKTIYIRLIEISGLYANLYQPEGQQDLNYAFIPEAFASGQPQPEDTTASSWTIDLYRVLLNNIRFDYDAEGTEMNLALYKLNMLFDKLGLEESHIQGDELDIDGLKFAMSLPPPAPADSTAAASTAAASTVATDTTTKDVLNPSGLAYSLNKLSIENSQIIYHVKQPDTTAGKQLNFENLKLDHLHAQVEDLHVGQNDIELYLQNLAFLEANSGFALNKLEARANVDMPKVAAELIDMQTSNSRLNGNMKVSLTLADDTKDLMKSLNFDSKLNQAVLGMADAAYFTNALDSMPAVRKLAPRLSWDVHIAGGDGKVNNLLLNVEDKAKLDANLAFDHLQLAMDSAATQSPYFNINLRELSVDLDFLRQFTSDSVGQYLQNMPDNKILLTAAAEGHLDDLKANAELRSGLGKMVTAATYVQHANKIANIEAQLSGERLDIRQLMKVLGNPDSVANTYGQMTFHADADVRALMSPHDTTLTQANVKLVVDRFDYHQHAYRGLTLQSQLEKDSLQAEMAYQDSLLEMHVNTQASLKADNPSYVMNLHLKNANLFRLQLVSDSVIVSNLLVQAEAQGNDPDSITGFVRVSDASIIKDDDKYQMDSLLLSADRDGDIRTFTLNSNEMNAEISGKFSVTQLPAAIEDFQQYYLAAYETPATGVDTVHTDDGKYQQLKFNIDIEKTPPLFLAFAPALDITQPLSVEGNFNSRDKSMNLDISAPHIIYAEDTLDSLYINAHTTEKTIDLKLASRYAKAGGITIPELSFTGSLSGTAEGPQVPSKKKLTTTRLDFNIKMGKGDSPYRLDLDALLSSRGDTTVLALNESELVLRDQAWQFSQNARLVYAPGYLDINDFSLRQNGQEIFITTDNKNSESDLKVAIKQIAIGPFLDAFDLEDYGVTGSLQADAVIKNMFKPGPITADLAINNLVVKDQQIGDFDLKAQKDSPESSGRDLLSLLMTLQGPNNDLKIQGNYNLAAEQDNINLQLDLNQLQLAPWQVFAKDYIKNLKGTLQANLKITGSPADPVINGTFAVANEVLLQTTIAGATYYLPAQKINFGGKTVAFHDFTLLDSARHSATLNGNVNFTNLTDPEVALSFKTKRFLFVNSEEYENPNFYGRAIATADLAIKGPVSSLNISGDVGVDKGTNMVISTVSGAEEVSQANFIEFVDNNAFLAADSATADSVKTTASAAQKDTVSISGFSMNTHVQLNPQAQFTILIDPVNGDKVVAAGEGDLQVRMSQNGDMNMQGTYVLNSGSYNLSFAGLVKKEFTIREGSTITWTGDPANAEMNLTAVYTTETTLEDLLAQYRDALTPQQLQAASTKQEVNVLLTIAGFLDAPQLSFDIEVPALSSGGAGASIQMVQDIIKRIQQNETELYKQVFGLIVLNRFIPTTGGFGSGESGGTLASVNEKIDSSVSRLLSSQLSSLTEQYLGGVEVNVGVQSDQTQASQTALANRDLNVELSKSLFNDRLTVSVGGSTTLESGQGGSSSSSSSEVMGQFEVLYRIDKSGNLNIRIFRDPQRNALTNRVEDNTGVSVYYQKAFDELFGKNDVLQSRPLEEEKDKRDNQNVQLQGPIMENDQRRKKGSE